MSIVRLWVQWKATADDEVARSLPLEAIKMCQCTGVNGMRTHFILKSHRQGTPNVQDCGW